MTAPLWTPPPDVRETTEIGRYLAFLEATRGRTFDGYEALWRWSVSDLEGFWGSLWEFFGIRSHAPYARVLADDAMPGARWFEGALLNYAEHLLAAPPGDVALRARSQTREPVELRFGELRDQVGRARAGLESLGVRRGDRVVGYLPSIPETVVAYAAAASLGAIWASCAPELGSAAAIDRLAQLEPTVLLAIGSYGYRDRVVDRRAEVAALRAAMPSLRAVVDVPYGPHGVPDATPWAELLAAPAPIAFDSVPFSHPLSILFSSGTTGRPKAIVHSHGGILLEHMKSHALSWDIRPGDRLQWFSTTSWMLWNSVVSALLLGASAVLIDGDPAWPELDRQWEIAAEERPTVLGMAPPYLMACLRAGLHPGARHDLGSIRVLATAGAPLPAEGYRYVYDELGPSVLLVNGSGGTDVSGGIVQGTPLSPVVPGEISSAALGVAARAFDPDGHEIVGRLGELVVTRPMPSMPVMFWGDADGSRYRAAYFDTYPGVWRHGDWIRFTPEGGCVVSGRSDATLNRGGVRMGTAELYGVVEAVAGIDDSLVVHLEDADGGPGRLILFVALEVGVGLDDGLRALLAGSLRAQVSPRHVPDEIVEVATIPRTLTGKKLETPVKRILQGAAVHEVASRDALIDPASLEPFVLLRDQGPARV
jgi:acetoacetyl-CoA synthetase